MDEVDSYGTVREHSPGWIIAAILTIIGSITGAILIGNQTRPNEGAVAGTVIGGLFLAAVFFGMYRASIGYTMYIRTKRGVIQQTTNLQNLALHHEFLQSVQKAVQEAKIRQ